MISLTQEKREELKAFLSASIENRCMVYTLAKQRELEALRDQIALALITAVPFGYVEEEAVKDRERLFSVQVFADEEDLPSYEFSELSYPLYLAPPVPEIKFPKKLHVGEIYHELTEKYGMDVSVDQLEIGLAEEVYSVAVNNFKQLNGLGE